MTQLNHAGAQLRQLMDAGPVMAPGALNALVAKAVAHAGFDACYVSGGSTSVCAGVPDVGLLTLDHFARVVREVCDAARWEDKRLPVLADADTGFGEEEMVRRTVIEYARAGAAGLHLEDQVFPKRCGHLDGKELVPLDLSVSKIQWAVEAGGEDFIVCARTDARGVDGFDAAVSRATAYVDAGASMVFPEGLTDEGEFERFAGAIKAHNSNTYLLANMTEFGKTPIISFERFSEMGYDLVIFPVTFTRVAMGAVVRGLATLKKEGSVEPLLEDMLTRDALYELIGYTPGQPWTFPSA